MAARSRGRAMAAPWRGSRSTFPAEAVLALSLLALAFAAEEEPSTRAGGVKASAPSGSPEASGAPALETLPPPPPPRGEGPAVGPVLGRGALAAGGGVAGGGRSKPKKDLGVLGYVLGLVMVVIIIAIGLGIVLGYLYKRGRDLRSVRERKAQEREHQRAALPLSAFVNRACDHHDHDDPPPCNEDTALEAGEGPSSHLAHPQAGTPGA